MPDITAVHQIPFIIWGNYDIAERNDLNLSFNYLGSLLMETAGLKLPSFYLYLKDLEESVPVITSNGWWDQDLVFHDITETNEAIEEYKMLMYNWLFDKQKAKMGYEESN